MRHCLMLLLVAAAVCSAQDRILMKNGNQMDARVISVGALQITVMTSFGEVQLPRREIASIVFDGTMVRVGLLSGTEVTGIISVDGALRLELRTENGPVTIERRDITSIVALDRISFDALGRVVSGPEAEAAPSKAPPLLRLLALDKARQPLRGWKAENIRLKVDGVEVPVREVSSGMPTRVRLLIDTSASMKRWSAELAAGVEALVRAMPPSTTYTIISVGDDVKAIEAPADPVKEITSLEFKGGSLLNDALIAAARETVQGSDAVILVTDGADTGSMTVQSLALQKVEATDAPFYSIGIVAPQGLAAGGKGGSVLDKKGWRQLAEISGGVAFLKDPAKEETNPALHVIFSQIASIMAAAIVVHPADTSRLTQGWHSIEMSVSRGGVKLAYREQVFFP